MWMFIAALFYSKEPENNPNAGIICSIVFDFTVLQSHCIPLNKQTRFEAIMCYQMMASMFQQLL